MRTILVATMLAAIPASVMAEPMSFESALALAAVNGPSVEAGRLEIEARRTAIAAADELPDPKLGVRVENFPVSGPPAFSLIEDDMTMTVIGLSQEVPSAARRRALAARATADVTEAEAAQALSVREARIAAGVAWLDLAFAERRLAAVNTAMDTIATYRTSGAAGVASGSVRPAETLDTQMALVELEDMRSEILAERQRARVSLVRWTGDPDPAVAGSLPHLEIDSVRLRRSVDELPQIELAHAQWQQAQSETALAVAGKRPDWMFDVAYQRRASRYGDMVSAGVTVSLPLFTARRQNPTIAARQADAQAVLARREDLRRSLAADLEASLADHAMHHDQWERARDTLLPLARQHADLEIASYAAGRASVQDVIAVRTAGVQAELLVLEREAEVMRDAVRINLTFGGSVDAAH
ncbi:MAG: transporter [Sphingomonadales bacterium 32-68-7]|nr:MAG: transporter [Sphingomonadales bacterium 12-68-11]OYX10075.1 MAG: transporter [Sphingomonadales bacterium 32-68-7]